jgi:hypothetical protein
MSVFIAISYNFVIDPLVMDLSFVSSYCITFNILHLSIDTKLNLFLALVMGTDTMAYTATALSFMLENLSKPVVFTGSQIPIAQPHSDARRNLVMALIFASRYPPINEVTIFFHDRLIR